MSREFKKKCCKKFAKKGKDTCKRCPLQEECMPSVDRKTMRKLLKKAYKKKFG